MLRLVALECLVQLLRMRLSNPEYSWFDALSFALSCFADHSGPSTASAARIAELGVGRASNRP